MTTTPPPPPEAWTPPPPESRWHDYYPAGHPSQYQVERKSSTAALVLGVLGVMFGVIPLTFPVAFVLGVLALVLGIVGWREKPVRRKLARAGTILGAIALGLSILGYTIVVGAFEDLERDLNCIGQEATAGCE